MNARRIILAVGTSALLTGCISDGQHVASISPAPAVAATPPVSAATEQPVRVSAVPSPQEIFDFHPGGAKTWREPIIIDPNDGPLSGYVRQTARELREFNEEQAARVAQSTRKPQPYPCSETDVASLKPGCAGARPNVGPVSGPYEFGATPQTARP